MYLLPFIGFFVLLRTSPMMYDGWAGDRYFNDIGGLIKWFFYIIGPYYQQINGRLAANFVSGILESFPSEIVLDSVNALVMTLICWCLCKVFNINSNKEKLIVSISYFSLILFIPNDMRAYVIQIANTAYIPPILFSLLFFLISRRYLKLPDHSPKWVLFVMCILSFSICTWMEHTAFGFGVVLALVVTFITIRDKKFYKYLWIAILVAFLSGLIMMLAPSLRSVRTFLTIDYKTMLTENFALFYKYLFRDNLVISIFFFLLLSVVMIQKCWNKSLFQKIICSFEVIIVCMLLVFTFNQYITQNQQITNFANIIYYGITNNLFIAIFVIFCILALTIYGVFLCRTRIPLFLLMLFGIFSLLPIIITPNISSRVVFIGLFMQVCLCIGFLSEIQTHATTIQKKILIIIITLLGILAVDQEILLCRRINFIKKERISIINEAVLRQNMGEWNYETDTLTLPVYREGDVHHQGIVIKGSFHYPLFLENYYLASETLLRFSNSEYYYVIVEQSGTSVSFKVESKLKSLVDERYYYVFLDTSGQQIFNSVSTVDSTWITEVPVGNYVVKAYTCNLAQDGSTIVGLELIDQPISLSITQ